MGKKKKLSLRLGCLIFASLLSPAYAYNMKDGTDVTSLNNSAVTDHNIVDLNQPLSASVDGPVREYTISYSAADFGECATYVKPSHVAALFNVAMMHAPGEYGIADITPDDSNYKIKITCKDGYRAPSNIEHIIYPNNVETFSHHSAVVLALDTPGECNMTGSGMQSMNYAGFLVVKNTGVISNSIYVSCDRDK